MGTVLSRSVEYSSIILRNAPTFSIHATARIVGEEDIQTFWRLVRMPVPSLVPIVAHMIDLTVSMRIDQICTYEVLTVH